MNAGTSQNARLLTDILGQLEESNKRGIYKKRSQQIVWLNKKAPAINRSQQIIDKIYIKDKSELKKP